MSTYAPQKKADETWIWIKHRLELRGLTFGKLARIHGVTKPNFTNVKRIPIPKYERIIANHIDKEPWDLWPSRYDAAQNPIRISTRYQGHKHFLNNTQTKPKSNVKDRRENCHEKKV